MHKFYYKLNKDLKKAIEDYKIRFGKNKNLKFVIKLNDKDVLDSSSSYESIINELRQNNIEPHNIVVAINTDERYYTQDEWNKIVEISKKLAKEGVKFRFEDQDKIFDIDQIKNANNKIVSISNDIKKQNLSPYEKLLVSYLEVTSRKYVQEDEVSDHLADSRSIYGVLNSDKIVCVGFSEWLKNILLELEDPNIKIYTNHVSCSEDNETISGYHENLIIYIKDDKYKIDGYYYLDPTWDCGHENKYLPNLKYFMVPLDDIEKIKYHIRSYWNSGLKPADDEEHKSRQVKRKKRLAKYSSIGKEELYGISFSSDKFDFTKEFLYDLFVSDPELFERMKEAVKEENNFCLYEKEIKTELLEKMKILIETSDINLISFDRKNEFTEVIEACLKCGSLDKFFEFEQKLKDDISSNKGVSKKDFLECFKAFAEEKIKLKEKRLEAELKESCEQEGLSYIEYEESSYEEDDENKKLLKEKIKNSKKLIKQMRSRINGILKQLETMFNTHPELEEYLKFMNIENVKCTFSDEYYHDGIYNISIRIDIWHGHLNDYTIEEIISEFRRFKPIGQKEMKEIIENYLADNNKKIDMALQDTLGENLDEIVLRVMANGRCKELVEEDLKEHSTVIDITMLIQAMTHILKKTTDMNEDEIYDYVKRVIEYNCNLALSHYEDSAINSFVQYALTYDLSPVQS